jgi:hypothetical protein
LQRSFRGVEIAFEEPVQISVESVVSRASRFKPRGVDVAVALLLATGNEDTYVISYTKNGAELVDLHLTFIASSLHRVRITAYSSLENLDTESRNTLLGTVARLLKRIHIDPRVLGVLYPDHSCG